MRFSRCAFRSSFSRVAMFTAIGLSGCGNSCFVGFFNGGNGGAVVKAGDPALPCSISQANGTVSALVLKSPVCASCTAAARVEHIFVTLQGVQVRASVSDDTTSPDRFELAPSLAREPRQIDLMGDPMPVTLVSNAIVPAGSYSEVRLQFFSGSPLTVKRPPAENACGETGWNCTVMADGRVEPLRVPDGMEELLIPSQSMEGGSLVVLPGGRMELRLSLQPDPGVYFSKTEGWSTQYMLVGRSSVQRQQSLEAEDLTPR